MTLHLITSGAADMPGLNKADRRVYGMTRRNGGAESVSLKLVLIHETPLTLIVRNEDKPHLKSARLSKDAIEWNRTGMGAPDDEIEVTLPEWLAVREGLI